MNSDKQIYTLIAQAEDIQRHAVMLQRTAQEAVKGLSDSAQEAVKEALKEHLIQGVETASKELHAATGDAKDAIMFLRRRGLFLAFLLVALALVVGGASYLISEWMIECQLNDLKVQIAKEEATLAKMKSKTWGLSLYEDSNGRFIVLPDGTSFDKNEWIARKSNAIRLIPR